MEAAEVFAEAAIEASRVKAVVRAKDPIPIGERIIARLRMVDSFTVEGVELKFSDDIWDMSARSEKPGSKYACRLNFKKAGPFADIAKVYCLTRLEKESVSVETIRTALCVICRFLSFADYSGYDDVAELPLSLYVDLRSQNPGISIDTRAHNDHAILSFLSFYELNFKPLRDRRCLRMLAKRDTARLRIEKKGGKTDAIEPGYLEDLLCICERVAHDEGESLDNRIIACCLMMYSQIGCRTRELSTFKAGGLSKTEGGDRGPDLWHADFKCSKRKLGRWIWAPTTCYMNDFALQAFRMLEKLCDKDRMAAGTDALVVFSGGIPFDLGRFYLLYHRFVLDCLSVPPFLNGPERGKGMQTKVAASAVRSHGWVNMVLDESANAALALRGLKGDDVLTYPSIRMFRNTVCTSLYLQGVKLKWIGEHLNHLYADMDAYYNRSERKVDLEFSNEIYHAVVEAGARIVGPNGDPFMEKIDKFIEKEGFKGKLAASPDEIIRKLSVKYPLKKKRMGMCIRCAAIAPCSVDGAEGEIVCALGVCPNHCSMYWMAAGTYSELKDAEAVVRANAARGFFREAQHELAKMKRVLDARFERELAELDRAVAAAGADEIIESHPDIAGLVVRRDEIQEEVIAWKSWQI